MYKHTILLNATVMPNEGRYTLKKITAEEAKKIVWNSKTVESYIGYPDTAKFMSNVLNIPVELNRTKFFFKDGDIAVVCKLKYRVRNPEEKGKFTPSPEDFEWYLESYRS